MTTNPVAERVGRILSESDRVRAAFLLAKRKAAEHAAEEAIAIAELTGDQVPPLAPADFLDKIEHRIQVYDLAGIAYGHKAPREAHAHDVGAIESEARRVKIDTKPWPQPINFASHGDYLRAWRA